MTPERIVTSDGYERAVRAADCIVVGAGPAGIAFAERLSRVDEHRTIVVLGDEPGRPYDRVRLSSLLAREVPAGALYTDEALRGRANVTVITRRRVVRIDRAAKAVHDASGDVWRYEHLVLATGSRPRIPSIPGIELPGVHVFRSMADAERLLARQVASRSIVVIGGGLLGLEAARAMRRFHTRVHVVEHEPRLMFHQLDDEAAALLREHVERLGIDVHTGTRVRQIVGRVRAEAVSLHTGVDIACDTVIVAAGIVPNIELARDAALAIGRGIRVDDRMQTTDAAIYAVGECTEHRGIVYGLVEPGFEQAAVAASNIAGIRAEYAGSTVASRLKVVGCPVFSLGEVNDSARSFDVHVFRAPGVYRRLNVHRGRVIGAVAVGEFASASRIRNIALDGRRVWPWQLARFAQRGTLWSADGANVAEWAADAIVCTCRRVTRGALDAALEAGAVGVAGLAERTGASTVCGSCRPLITDLIGASGRPPLPRMLLGASVLAAVACAVALAARIPYVASMQGPRWDVLWTDPLLKQVTGFSLLGLALLLSLVSVRKRAAWLKWLAFPAWRLAHVVGGVAALAVLAAHTGFRFGANLDMALMLCFTGSLLAGAVGGGATAFAQRYAGVPKRVRSAALWSHLLLLAPLPALLCFHVLASYYF